MSTTDSAAPERIPAAARRGGRSAAHAPEEGPAVRAAAVRRFLPAATAYLFLVILLLGADTAPGDVARYTGYVLWGVLTPGTLVFRALRRRPHSLLEDLAFGAVTGLALELAAWFVLVSAGAQSLAVAWPLVVVIPFAAVPRLRRHWRPRGYVRPSQGWSWAVAGAVMLSSAYFYAEFLSRFPVVPTDENTRIFGDIPYMLSLAGNAKQHAPLTLPQAAGEPLNYHWFSFAHMAMTDLVGHIDLPVVENRLMVPALAALALLITAVVAQRLTGRTWAGPLAALLVFAIGEFTAAYPNNVDSWLFGAPAVRLMYWSSVSLAYSQPLLIALLGVIGDGLRSSRGDGEQGRSAPPFGPGMFVLTAMFALASSAAKASTLPVTLAGLAVTGVAVLVGTRRIPWRVVGLGAIVAGAQLFATAVIFKFESYGLKVIPFGNVQRFWADPGHSRATAVQAAVIAATLCAFLLHHHVKLLGMIPLLWRRRLRLEPVQWFLLGAAVAGPCAYLVVNGYNASYFTIAALPFGVVLSAWGYCESFERAALPSRAKAALGVSAAVFVALLTFVIYRCSSRWSRFVQHAFGAEHGHKPYAALLAALAAAAVLAASALAVGLLWRALGRAWPALRGRGGIVLLTAGLAVGGPGLLHDALQSREVTWQGSWVMPGTQVEAARWIRGHSAPSDVLVTNSHCWEFDDYANGPACDNVRSQWLSGYSERSVLVEGWAYAPRAVALTGGGTAYNGPFWDQALFRQNEDAVYRPTAENLRLLRERYHVRYVVAHRPSGAESPLLGSLAERVFDNGRVAVYRLAD